MAMDDSTIQELSREVSSLSRIRHGFIIQFYGLTVLPNFRGSSENVIAMVTERCVGSMRGE